MFGHDGPITRRHLLGTTAKLAVVPWVGAFLAACSAPAASPTAEPAKPAAAAATTAPAAGATTVPATAAPAAAKPKGNVVWWYPTKDPGEEAAKSFNDAQSDVKVEWQLGEFDTNTKIMAALAASTPPDIAYLGRWQGPDLAVRNGIKALDDYIKGSSVFKWENLWSRLQKDSVQWGKKWGIPYFTDTRALYYNKDVMAEVGLDPEKPPVTFDDIEAYSAKMLKKDSAGRLDRVGFTPSFGNPPTFLMFYTMVWCYGGDFITEDLKKVAFTEKGPEAMAYLKKLMDQQGGYEQAAAFTKALTFGEGLDAFSTGKVGMAMNGNWAFPNYQKYAPNLKYGITPGPYFPQYKVNANYDGGGALYFFKQGQGKNFEGAWAFAEHLLQPKVLVPFADKLGAMPARADVGEDWLKLDKRRDAFLKTADTVRWIPIMVGTLEMLSHIAKMFDDILYGRAPVDQAMKLAADNVQQIVDKHNSFPPPQG